MVKVLYKIGELFLGKNFAKGSTYNDYLRDVTRLLIFMFSPWILLVIGATIMSLLEML